MRRGERWKRVADRRKGGEIKGGRDAGEEGGERRKKGTGDRRKGDAEEGWRGREGRRVEGTGEGRGSR